MPKKIDVSKDKILDIADRILQKDGYKALSVRKARKSAAHIPSARSQRLCIVGKRKQRDPDHCRTYGHYQ